MRLASAGAVLGSLSAAVAFLATGGSVQAAPAAAGSSLTSGAALAITPAAKAPPGVRRIGADRQFSAASRRRPAPRDPAALNRYATEVATPGSAVYHDYLPKGAFASVFGPTATAISTVRASLSALGLKVGKITANRLSFPVTATAGAVERAFRTTLATYRLAGGGAGFANTSAPRLPASVAPYVQAVFGLNTLLRCSR